MRRFFARLTTFLLRILYIAVAAVWIASAGAAAVWSAYALGQTSYRFVAAFIIIILLSNILAKLAIAYIKA
ncbi:MAG TPA: hypothetical protein VG934_03695 [Candidatus Paceibacterota bacterium]|nr:hypothetical protein [Candidatus Paceibacterota bacterium]